MTFKSTSFKKVGFIGLGQMGSAMANSLLRSGMELTVYDIAPNKLETMHQLGASVADCAAAVAATPSLDALITMLPDSSHVEAAYRATDGILAADSSCRLFIDSSTTAPDTSRSIAQALQQQTRDADDSKVHFLDAPVSGGVIAAGNRTLSFLCGGSRAAFDTARPLLSLMGERILHTGPEGTGQCAKMCNNLVMAASMAAVSEALAVGSQLGLEPKLLSEVFNCSSARCWSSDTYNPVPGFSGLSPASRNYQGGFTHRLMVKDLLICQRTAAQLRGTTPVTEAMLAIYQQAYDELGSEKDFSSVYQMYLNALKNIDDRSLEFDKQM